jgi:succinate CoA transferase
MANSSPYPKLTPEETAAQIPHGATVGFSGFSPAGAAKVLPRAIAARAEDMHAQGKPYQIRVLTGASSGETVDGVLAAADAISWRAPYQSDPALRDKINRGEVEFVDLHLSHVPQTLSFGFFGKIDFAIVEATEITPDGLVYLTTSIGASPTYLRYAEKVIIEVNWYHSMRLREMADIMILPPPPHRNPIPINHPLTKVGWPYAVVDPNKVIAVVENDEPDHIGDFMPPGRTSEQIAKHVVKFLLDELRAGRIPAEFLPLQAGVGNVANAVMSHLGEHPEIPPFAMYSEVLQDALVDLMEQGKVTGASASSLTVSPRHLKRIYRNMDFFAPKIVLRPQELSNHPGVIRRLGVIAINTALEVDIYGNVNSTHVCGMHIMNGVGGSGDFNRNSYLSIDVCPSIAKAGKISTIVPMCPHIDNSEHSVQIIATEQGLADLRGLGPIQRARKIIDHCAHPAYREYLHRYLEQAHTGHIRHDLTRCFELHRNLLEQGAMLPDLDLSQFS